MVPPIKLGPKAEKIGRFIALGFVVGYEGEWGVEWSENVYECPVEIERRRLRLTLLTCGVGCWFGIWWVSSLGSCDSRLIFLV